MPSRVLVAGLDSRSLLLEAPMLQREGHAVVEPGTTRALLEDLAAGTTRLVVLGTALTDLTLLELIRRIRTGPATRGVSILILVPVGEPSELDGDALRAGANAVLRRPLDPVILQSWAAKLLAVPRRVETRVTVEAQLVGSPKDGSGHFCGLTVNVSVNGMLLASPVRLAVGPDLDLEFSFPGGTARLTALGRVVREAPEVGWPYIGYGVEFLFVPDSTQEVLHELVSEPLAPEAEAAANADCGIHSTLRREEWIYEILQPVHSAERWQVEIRRAAREGWRPGVGGPFYVVQGATPREAVTQAREFVLRHG